MFKNFLQRTFKINKNEINKIFDYNFYDKNYDQYIELIDNINIKNTEEVDQIFLLLEDFSRTNQHSKSFNPIEEILRYFNRNQYINPDILTYYFENALPVLRSIISHVSDTETKGIILESLVCIQTRDSIDLFIDLLAEKDLNNYTTYNSIKQCIDLDEKMINLFFNKSKELLTHGGLITVGITELFSQWVKDNKIAYHPLQGHLHIVEEWLTNTDYNELGHAISGCAALSTIKTENSIRLLKVAANHPKLEIQLESTFSLAVLEQEGVIEKLKQLVTNPIISNKTVDYIQELEDSYEIYLDLSHEIITSTTENQEDFAVMSAMSEWCAHECEYGITPDEISVWCKKEMPWPPSQKKTTIYLIKYKYNNSCMEGVTQDIEHVGYYNSDTGIVFSTHKAFDNIDNAYSAYFNFEKELCSGGI